MIGSMGYHLPCCALLLYPFGQYLMTYFLTYSNKRKLLSFLTTCRIDSFAKFASPTSNILSKEIELTTFLGKKISIRK